MAVALSSVRAATAAATCTAARAVVASAAPQLAFRRRPGAPRPLQSQPTPGSSPRSPGAIHSRSALAPLFAPPRARAANPFRRRALHAPVATMAAADTVQIDLVPCLSDNYSFLIHDPASGLTAAVDPAEVKPFVDVLEERSLQLDFILNTHHHWDHVGGNEELKQKYGATIVGPKADQERIPGIDVALGDGEVFKFGAHELTVLDTPGHTKGHIVYHMPSANSVFVGDTLFALGCGRLFEGTPEQMFASLAKLKALPGATKVYCAHEYTQANARFCLSRDASPALVQRAAEITRLRDQGLPTVPSTIEAELATNPFLLAATAADFAEVRRAKDQF